MRIVIDYTPALRQGAGIGRYTRGLVAGLAEIDSANEYTLFCGGQAPQHRQWPGNFRLVVSRLPARWLGIGWHRLHLPLPAEWLSGRCDIFHSPDFTLPPLWRANGVVTVHDLSFLRLPQCADPGLQAYLAKAVPDAVGRSRRVLADSLNTKRDLWELMGVPEQQVSVVRAGIEPRFCPVTDRDHLAQVRTRYGLPERFILSVGTLEPRKNYVGLIAAYARLCQSGKFPQSLVIAGGRGWLYDEVFSEVERHELGDRVCFPGFVADEDLPALYSLSDLFVFPSLYEGFGIPPLEAMACGVPVISSNNSSLPEAVGDGGLQVDALDTSALAAAMESVLGDALLAHAPDRAR